MSEEWDDTGTGSSAGESIVAAGNTLVRLENSTQMAVSVQRPRDEGAILMAALKELELYPSMAEEAIYSKPVGKDDSGKMTYAEGLSIRAAESLANRWKNSAFGVDLVSEDEDTATIAAVFLDYEMNTRHVVQQRVSKWFKSRKSGLMKYSPDRFDIVLKANGSKILREAILRSLPGGLKKEYEQKARRLLTNKPESKRVAIVERFAVLGVTVDQLVKHVGKDVKDWKKDELVTLLGIYNAVREGEITAEETFGTKADAAPNLEGSVKAKEGAETKPGQNGNQKETPKDGKLV
jgi:hypothetical protein